MTSHDSLDSSIKAPDVYNISTKTKCEILKELWDVDIHPEQYKRTPLDHDIYFSFYAKQCGLFLHESARHISARTHRDIVNIAKSLKESVPRDQLTTNLKADLHVSKPTSNKDELVSASIHLTASLLLMIDFCSLDYSFSGGEQLQWTEGSIKDCVGKHFKDPGNLAEKVKLEPAFNALNLIRIAGLEIEWTTNLGDHLRLKDNDKTVAIFHYASFLECQDNSSLFPIGFIEETLRTLALLFPQTDRDTKIWSKKVIALRMVDSRAFKCQRLTTADRQIGKFVFWRERLIILKQFFDETEPSTLSQWWHDRRKGVIWYTFWVAAVVLLMTFFFGVVQCAEGALQVYKAFQPA